MKKIYGIILAAIMTFSFALTCAAAESGTQTAAQSTTENRTLIAYFSHTGNTETVAGFIQSQTGGDLVELIPVNAYPTDYDSTVAVASRELEQQARPRLQTTIENMDAYDTIYIGYPIWWSTIPMPVATFLESYDFSGKTVIPFCTHEGSGLADSVSAIRQLVPQATVLAGLAVRGSEAEQAQNAVTSWINAATQRTQTEIQLMVGDNAITVALNNTKTAQDIAAALPLTINMRNWDDKAYFGRIRGEIDTGAEQHHLLQAGDVVHWIEGNALMLYYDAARDTNITTPVITVGRITSDLEALQNIDSSAERYEVQAEIKN